MLFHNLYNLVGYTQVLNVIPSDIAFGQPPEFVSFRARLHDFFQSQIHVGIAIHKMSVQRLAIFELDEHRMALRRGEETEWKHIGGG